MAHKRGRCVAIATALILLAAVVQPACLRAHGAEPEPESAVRAVLERQVADWNKHDLDAFLAGYWNSPKLVFQSGGRRVDGWETVRDRYRRRYQAEGRSMGELTFAALEIERLATDAVLVRGSWSVKMPDGTQPHGLFTLIFRRFKDGWKIVHDHTSADEPAAPRSPASAKKAAE
jgi:ketosteroid isomerase-like protein